ncbi:MAG: anaerobic magnesium-protoporphyrin IX monomethyl ester cyclase [Myxococcota bacterium]
MSGAYSRVVTVLLAHLPVGFEESYPLALAAIAAPVVADGHVVEGIDLARVGLDGLSARLARGDVSVLGMSVWTPAVPDAQRVMALAREAASKPLLVTGGPHATLQPDDVDADVVVLGEGEASFAAVVNAQATGGGFGEIAGLYLPGTGRTGHAEPLDLANVLLPNRRVFAVADYHRDHLPRGRGYASSVTSRGCQYRCSFCSAPALWGKKHRYRPAESVVEEWRELHVDFGVNGVLVEDDLFTHHKRRVAELCEALIRSGSRMTWELLNGIRPETVDQPLLELMARAGCTRLAFSLETADKKRLTGMGRSADLERVAQSVSAAQGTGIGVTGYFMVGLPGETRAERRETFQFASRLKLDMAHFSVASAWPGTTWTTTELSTVTAMERSALYAAWYLHPARALRAAKMLGIRKREVLDMARRLGRWMTQPLEERRVLK